MAKEALQEHLPYQQAAQVRQHLAERAEAVTLGQTTRVEAMDKVLKGLGWKEPEKAPEVRRNEVPKGRSARADLAKAAEDGEDEAPANRRAPGKSTT